MVPLASATSQIFRRPSHEGSNRKIVFFSKCVPNFSSGPRGFMLQGDLTGFNPGNGEKLSNGQAWQGTRHVLCAHGKAPGRAWTALGFPPFPALNPVRSHCAPPSALAASQPQLRPRAASQLLRRPREQIEFREGGKNPFLLFRSSPPPPQSRFLFDVKVATQT